jgi:hypothetical protein
MLRDKLVASLDAGFNGMELSNVAHSDSTITKVVKQLDGVFVKEAKVGLLSLSLVQLARPNVCSGKSDGTWWG